MPGILRHVGGDGIEQAVDLPAQQILHGRGAALVRHVVMLGRLALDLQQFAEQVTAFTMTDNDPAHLPGQFRFIPPTGLLPVTAHTFLTGAQATTLRIGASRFFPATFEVDAVPAPIEQLDRIADACAPLAAFDLFTGSQVTVVVPVPQPWYEPDLLKVAQIDPVFQDTVNQFNHVRSIWLKRRADVRSAYSALTQGATGKPAQFPDPDPDAVENEPVSDTEIDDKIDAFKTAESSYGTATANGALTVSSITDVKTKLSAMPGVKDEVPRLDALGLGQFAALLQTKADAANDHIDLGFLRIQTDIYRTRQKMLSEEAATRLAVSPALASIAQGVSAVATKDDLTEFLKNAKITLNTPTTTPLTLAPAPAAVEASTFSVEATAEGVPFSPVAAPFAAAAILTDANVPLAKARTATIKDRVQTATFTGATALFTGTSTAALAASSASVVDVTSGRPIVGGGYDLRTTSVVLRLEDPRTAEVKSFTLASKYAAVSTFKKATVVFNGQLEPGISIGDVEIPGFQTQTNPTDPILEARKKFSDISDVTLNEILAGTHDRLLNNPDEASIFSAGVRSMENTVDILRLMEARVEMYRQAAQLCRDALTGVNANAASAIARLQAITNSLGEARHDVAFAKALMTEEQQRLDAINSRRDQIILNQVRFLAYFRPRTVEARSDLPVRSIDPGLSSAVIPTCLARNLAAPDELRAYVNLLREAPVNWFRHVTPVINRFDRLDVLQNLLQNSKLRAGFKVAQAVATPVLTSPGPLAVPIAQVISGQQQILMASRQATAQLDLTTFAGASWSETRDRAASVLSIGDLVDLGHYHPEVPRVSAAEIENILKVSACLYSDLTGVLPVLRLNWAERLDQVGGTLNLANLAALPRWGEVPALERKEMQAIVDWLFSRINPDQPSAVSHINDLVRVAILLASHAPVADIIAGDVIRTQTITPGSRLDLKVDLTRVRTGMHVLVYQANQPVARAVVEDLSGSGASARVVTMTGASLTLNQGAKVQFATADAFSRNLITAGLL